MDEIFSRMGGRVKCSITDSTIMAMLHSEMDKAHEKVHSKEGVIARLHEISKFYELAVMQLEGCLKFVLEEADSSLESSDEEALGDLADIRDRLQGRLREAELAISEKDRELTDRLENEMKLRQALEIKERELESLRANLELQITKSEGNEEQVLGDMVNVDVDRGEEFSELKSSVDQQVWNIKQQLDPDDEVIDKGRYQGFESMKIEQMSSDIDILKETMDLAFEKMQSAIFLSELEPTEQQSVWTLEKDVIVILIKGFMGDIQDKFTAEVRRWQNQVSTGLNKYLSDLMKEITCLQEELEAPRTFQSGHEGKISFKMKGKSSSVGDISDIPDDFSVRVGKIEQTKQQLSVEDSEEDTALSVAKMIKSHETIIRRKSEELKLHKREFLKEKVCSDSRRSEKGPVSPRQRFRDVTAKLGNLLHWRANLGEAFAYHGGEDQEETSSAKRISNFDMIKQAKFHDIDASEKVNSISISHDANDELHNEIRKLKMEKEDANLQNVMVEDTYITLLEGLIHECCSELNSYDIAILVREGIYEHILKEMVNEWDEKLQGDNIEDQITEDMFYLVSREALKDCSSTLDSALTECQDAAAESNFLQEHTLEGTIREEIFRTFLGESFKEWDEAIEWNDGESIAKEDMYRIVFEETIRDMANTANHMVGKFENLEVSKNSMECSAQGNSFVEYLEYSMKEDIFMVFLKEMSKQWKAEIDSYNFEILIREEILLLILMEAMTETQIISGESKAKDQFRILEDFTSADKLPTSLDTGKEEDLVEKQDSQPEHIKLENLKGRASPGMKEDNTLPGIVALKHEELNKLQDTSELLTKIDSTSNSVCSNVKKALEQVALSKGLLRELRSSLGVPVEDIESFDDQTAPTIPFQRNVKHSRLHQEQNKEVSINLPNSDFTSIQELLQVFIDFKRKVEKKLVLNILRVEEAIHYLNPLVELVALQRREDWLYKKAFLRRCENLRRAETEVDLLGDQVDALLGLLEKIYRTLNRYSPTLQQHFEVSDILKMIEEELIRAVRAPAK